MPQQYYQQRQVSLGPELDRPVIATTIKDVHSFDSLKREKRASYSRKAFMSTRVHHGNVKKGLTPRELEILTRLATGRTDKEIARDLLITEKTVNSHLNRIFRKLEVTQRLEAILCAIREGLT
jgi:DNA-binding NarL/FixJ family response regulator